MTRSDKELDPREHLKRQWALLDHLQTSREGFTLEALADEFEVNVRTIQRDLITLKAVALPIETRLGDDGKDYWSVQYNLLKTVPLLFTLDEAMAWHVAIESFAPLTGTHFAEALDQICSKISHHIPKKAQEYFTGLDEIVYVRRQATPDRREHARTISLLDKSTREDHSIEMTYRAPGRKESFSTRFDPYGLVFYEDDLYVLGHSHVVNALRIFKVCRIQSASPTDQKFRRPAGFNLAEQFRSSYGIFQNDGGPVEDVRVRFTGMAADWVKERKWHDIELPWSPVEETLFGLKEPAPDGITLRRYKLARNGLPEFKKWVKGFGALAEVLGPQFLRDEMRAELLAAAELYNR